MKRSLLHFIRTRGDALNRPSVWIRTTALFAATFMMVAFYPAASNAADPNDIYWIPDRNLLGNGAFVDDVVIAEKDIYYGGSFDIRDTDIRDCAHWNGTKWSSLGGGVGTRQMGMVHVIARSGNNLYVG